MDVTKFFKNFISRTKTQTGIIDVALVGSYAHGVATKESDTDLMILTDDAAKYFENQKWLALFGEVEESNIEDRGWVETIRAFYKNSFEAEYNFTVPDWAKISADAGTFRVVKDGMKILYDPKGIFDKLQNAVLSEYSVKS